MQSRVLASSIVASIAILAVTHQAPAKRPEPAKPCAHTKRVETCLRRELRDANKNLAWQKKARNKARAGTSRDIVLDAIQWASRKTGVAAWRLRAIGECESHLFYRARNGQYLGVWQLGATHRSDPLFDVMPWSDPYAQALHVARFIKAHGSGAWQCSEYGGLRW